MAAQGREARPDGDHSRKASAEIHVPAAAEDQVTVKSDPPADPVRRDERYAVFATGSGTHVFEVRPNAASAS